MKPYPHDRQPPMNYSKKISLVAGLILGLTGLMGSLIDRIGIAPVTAQTVEQRRTEADRLTVQSTEQFQANQFEAALKSIQQALLIYREVKDRRSEQIILNQIGIGYTYRGNYPAAIQALEQSLAIANERQDDIGQVDALMNVGSARIAAGDYTKAVVDSEKALAIAIKIKNPLGEATALSGIGNSYTQLGNYAKAIGYFERGLALHQAIKDQPGTAKVLNSLGFTYALIGNYPKAIDYYEQSLKVKRAIRDRVGESITLGNISFVYEQNRDYKQAITYGQQALAINRELKTPNMESTTLAFLGRSYQGAGDRAKAIEYHQQSLAVASRIDPPLRSPIALGGLAEVYASMGEHAKAIDYGQQSLAIARELKHNLGEGRLLTKLAVSWMELGKLSEAETALRSAIMIWETQRGGLSDQNKIAITETQAESYQLLQQVLVRQNRTEVALEIAEKGRARAFAELLAARSNGNPITSTPAPNLDAIRRIAKAQNATLVEYSIVDAQQLYIWVIKPTGEIVFRTTKLDAKKSLNQLVKSTRRAIGVRGRGANAVVAANTNELKQLHQSLIAPIVQDLPQDPNDRVIFLPQGALFLAPFAALQNSQGKYLIEQHTIATAPSIQTLELTRTKTQPAKTTNPVVVGDPTMPLFDNAQLPALPGARQEAIDIAKILKAQALTGDQATKTTVLEQMQTASIVHLATHGLLDTIAGDIPGAVALAPSGKDDGLLTSSEIFNLKLNASLVVLSACDTGGGDITGDGVIGLSRSFIAAGVPSLVVSLWAVNDNSTSVLMSDFYRNLKTNPNKAQALRKAMLTTMQQYPNPSDWAAFTLVGETDRRD